MIFLDVYLHLVVDLCFVLLLLFLVFLCVVVVIFLFVCLFFPYFINEMDIVLSI